MADGKAPRRDWRSSRQGFAAARPKPTRLVELGEQVVRLREKLVRLQAQLAEVEAEVATLQDAAPDP